jgi:curli production assembly/transport component CsgG
MRWLMFIGMLFLAGCVSVAEQPSEILSQPKVQSGPMSSQLEGLPTLAGNPMTIGVYSFTDKTGQRKPNDRIANLSSAVTQGAESWVIDALLFAGNGTWFEVVERSGLDNLMKERQLIRNTRENYLDDPEQLDPMKFAGLILEGGIVGYDSNVATGGTGARYLVDRIQSRHSYRGHANCKCKNRKSFG